MLIKVFSPAYFAREDTKTPMRYASISLTVNTLGSIALFFLFRSLGMMPQLGIAVATTLGGWLNAGLLWWTLRQRGQFVADARLVRVLPLMILASLAMGAALFWGARWLEPYLHVSRGIAVEAGALAVLVTLGMLVYAAAIFATGVMNLSQLGRFTRRK